MTINPNTNQYREPDPRRKTPHTTKAIILVALLAGIGGIIYAFATGDRNQKEAANPPATTTASGTATTPAPQIPAGSGTQRP
jgi:hypothetical protein